MEATSVRSSGDTLTSSSMGHANMTRLLYMIRLVRQQLLGCKSAIFVFPARKCFPQAQARFDEG